MSLVLQILKKKTERLEGGEFRRQYLRSLWNHAEAVTLSACITGDIDKQEFKDMMKLANIYWKKVMLDLSKGINVRDSYRFNKLQSIKLKNMGILMMCFNILQKQEEISGEQSGDIFSGDPYALGTLSYEQHIK